MTPEHKAKIAAALKGRVFSDETRAKMSAARKRRTTTPETRARLAEAGAGRHHSQQTRATLSAARTTNGAAFWAKVARGDGCWEWQGYRQGLGYGLTSVGSRLDGTKRAALAHRRAWELANGPIPDGVKVLHRCDNRACCRPDHLFLGSQTDNIRDMEEKGRANRKGNPAMPALRGEDHPLARLTEADVQDIRRRRGAAEGPSVKRVRMPADSPDSVKALAAEYGVHEGTIIAIVRRRLWAHTTDSPH